MTLARIDRRCLDPFCPVWGTDGLDLATLDRVRSILRSDINRRDQLDIIEDIVLHGAEYLTCECRRFHA